MGQIAVLLLILGFGTFVLDLFDYEFRVLEWARDYQPWLSLGLGVLGLVILAIRFFAGRGKDAPADATKEA